MLREASSTGAPPPGAACRGAGRSGAGRPGGHSRALIRSLDTLEYSLHAIHARDVVPGAMISASFTLGQPLSTPDIGIARTCAAKMNERGQVLFALERREFQMMALEGGRYTAIEVRRGELHRMRGDYPSVQSIEPA